MSIEGTKLTLNDITILGLLIEEEKGVTGLQLEKAIETRGMRIWTTIGKSSVYHALRKLQKRRYVISKTSIYRKDSNSPPVKEKYHTITSEGRRELEKAVYTIIANHKKLIDPFDIAFAFSGVLAYERLVQAFLQRINQVQSRKKTLEQKITEFTRPGSHGFRLDGTPVSHELVLQHVIALFTRPLALVEAEEEWLRDYLEKIVSREVI